MRDDEPSAHADALLRKMRAAERDPRQVWERVLEKARRGEVNLYCETLAREALALLARRREPGDDDEKPAIE